MELRALLLRVFWLLLLVVAGSVSAQSGLGYSEQVYDFGHVGIDYQVFHEFKLFNSGAKPIKIDSMQVPCDCSTAQLLDSTLHQGDTIKIRLMFNTKDFYGMTSKSLAIFTNDPLMPKLDLYYVSTIGQWLQGLKPDPISLFFLPGQQVKKVVLTNKQFEKYTISVADQANDFIQIRILRPLVSKSGTGEVEVAADSKLQSGTYNTSFRLKADVPELKAPIFLTIPVKIVRY